MVSTLIANSMSLRLSSATKVFIAPKNLLTANFVSAIGAMIPFTPRVIALYISVTASTPPIFIIIGSPTLEVISFSLQSSSCLLPSFSYSALISKTPYSSLSLLRISIISYSKTFILAP